MSSHLAGDRGAVMPIATMSAPAPSLKIAAGLLRTTLEPSEDLTGEERAQQERDAQDRAEYSAGTARSGLDIAAVKWR